MKKIFSTVAMAIVALTAVVSMTSCNDDPSAFNAATPVDLGSGSDKVSEKAGLDYSYKATIPDDVLALYDVTIVRTAGSQVKEYTLTEDKNITNAKTSGNDTFTVEKGTYVEVKATFTLKANFQEFLDKRMAEKGETAQVDFSIFPVFNFPIPSTGKYRISSLEFLSNHKMYANMVTEEKLKEFEVLFSDAFSVNNK